MPLQRLCIAFKFLWVTRSISHLSISLADALALHHNKKRIATDNWHAFMNVERTSQTNTALRGNISLNMCRLYSCAQWYHDIGIALVSATNE
ncbi:uncharacterized protein EDB93DRAFT_306457 [Suillus bovinus]|uniref:uncharacterized protein n=1 Tax=Suillus bovinus TaxID=48563 RepID=UPI001B85E7B9|nr:uncharacterized protein EDB93DRAFT_306457 [Suillus bovinus]KAG2151233.1 hypothetical protein EDB93DRAFT_306457 [Suillus bovinus]